MGFNGLIEINLRDKNEKPVSEKDQKRVFVKK